ncbi:MAG: hypothetical protein EKK41_21530 [Hyphomicrobiales bacterium]|nr:MAG: hypothetical protein EKK41_21530 [Hyphomicrobiales bacterium]
MKTTDPDYQRLLKAYRASRGGVPMDQGMIAAQGWAIAREREFQRMLEAQGIELEIPAPPAKAAGRFTWS